MISILGIILIVGSIILYKSFAFYKEEKVYNILQGRVPDFNYDLKLAVTLDGEKVESIPVKEENVYYQVNVTCNEGTGKWNYTKWLVEVSDFSSNTKCNVAFTKAEEEIKDPEIERDSYQVVKNGPIEIPEGTTKALCVWLPITTYNFDYPQFSGDIVVSVSRNINEHIDTVPSVKSYGYFIYEIQLTGEAGTLVPTIGSSGSGTRSYNWFLII